MSIKIRKEFVAIHSMSGDAVAPEYMDWKKLDIREYLQENPFPVDENYSVDDLINDLTDSSGALTFAPIVKDETIKFIETLMNWLTYEHRGGSHLIVEEDRDHVKNMD